jgi:hypothetical protein
MDVATTHAVAQNSNRLITGPSKRANSSTNGVAPARHRTPHGNEISTQIEFESLLAWLRTRPRRQTAYQGKLQAQTRQAIPGSP